MNKKSDEIPSKPDFSPKQQETKREDSKSPKQDTKLETSKSPKQDNKLETSKSPKQDTKLETKKEDSKSPKQETKLETKKEDSKSPKQEIKKEFFPEPTLQKDEKSMKGFLKYKLKGTFTSKWKQFYFVLKESNLEGYENQELTKIVINISFNPKSKLMEKKNDKKNLGNQHFRWKKSS